MCFNTGSNPLDATPTLQGLHEVIVRVAGKWESVGLQLNIDDYVLHAIRTPNGSNEDHCREMFRRWLAGERGCGALPKTWSSVLHAVQIGYGSEVGKKILDLLYSYHQSK